MEWFASWRKALALVMEGGRSEGVWGGSRRSVIGQRHTSPHPLTPPMDGIPQTLQNFPRPLMSRINQMAATGGLTVAPPPPPIDHSSQSDMSTAFLGALRSLPLPSSVSSDSSSSSEDDGRVRPREDSIIFPDSLLPRTAWDKLPPPVRQQFNDQPENLLAFVQGSWVLAHAQGLVGPTGHPLPGVQQKLMAARKVGRDAPLVPVGQTPDPLDFEYRAKAALQVIQAIVGGPLKAIRFLDRFQPGFQVLTPLHHLSPMMIMVDSFTTAPGIPLPHAMDMVTGQPLVKKPGAIYRCLQCIAWRNQAYEAVQVVGEVPKEGEGGVAPPPAPAPEKKKKTKPKPKKEDVPPPAAAPVLVAPPPPSRPPPIKKEVSPPEQQPPPPLSPRHVTLYISSGAIDKGKLLHPFLIDDGKGAVLPTPLLIKSLRMARGLMFKDYLAGVSRSQMKVGDFVNVNRLGQFFEKAVNARTSPIKLDDPLLALLAEFKVTEEADIQRHRNSLLVVLAWLRLFVSKGFEGDRAEPMAMYLKTTFNAEGVDMATRDDFIRGGYLSTASAPSKEKKRGVMWLQGDVDAMDLETPPPVLIIQEKLFDDSFHKHLGTLILSTPLPLVKLVKDFRKEEEHGLSLFGLETNPDGQRDVLPIINEFLAQCAVLFPPMGEDDVKVDVAPTFFHFWNYLTAIVVGCQFLSLTKDETPFEAFGFLPPPPPQ